MNELKIWKMSVSCEEDRPQIDLEKQNLTWDDWGDLKQEFPPDIDVIQSPQTLKFHIDAPDALEWDWYGVNFWGAWSQRAKDLLWPCAKKYLRCFQASLNGAPYYILRVDEELALDCLDYDHAELNRFPSSGRVARVLKYAFRPRIIHDPLIFHAKNSGDILCTESIHRMVLDAGLKGFSFADTATLRQSPAV
jgi:hypothetical protein